MTTSGEPTSGAGGADDADWIDQILERATKQSEIETPPIVPDVAPTPSRTPTPADTLAEVRWVEEPQVAPASATITPPATALTPSAVGRSAWDDQLAVTDDADPDGWEKLSWQDLDERADGDHSPVRESSSASQVVREWGRCSLLRLRLPCSPDWCWCRRTTFLPIPWCRHSKMAIGWSSTG